MSAEPRRLGPVEYADLVGRVRAAITRSVPPGSSLLVISKGDPGLLEFPGLSATHFPQDSAGGYAGHHPFDSATAIAEIEALRRGGAEYLVIPATARWWLDYYDGLARHLANHGTVVTDQADCCLIYGLGRFGTDAVPAAAERSGASIEQVRDFLRRLIPPDATVVVLEGMDGEAGALAPLETVRLSATAGVEEGALLRELRRQSATADYLVVPRSSDEWLQAHAAVAAVVEDDFRKIADQRHLCRVFALDDRPGPVR
jgi:hypothetical protein